MEEQIIEIIMSEIFDKFHIVVTDYTNLNNAAAKIEAVIADRMPTEEEIDREIGKRYYMLDNPTDLDRGFTEACEWFRGCMKNG